MLGKLVNYSNTYTLYMLEFILFNLEFQLQYIFLKPPYKRNLYISAVFIWSDEYAYNEVRLYSLNLIQLCLLTCMIHTIHTNFVLA